MPLEQAVWRIDERLRRLSPVGIAKEVDLERFIEEDVSILSPDWLVIGRQVNSDVGPIDLLALDRNGSLVVIELKRNQTTRDVIAQALDYASWAETRTTDEIAGIYSRYCERYKSQDRQVTLDDAFRMKFSVQLPVEDLNSSHQIVIVASELDGRTERIVRYLSGRGIEINILFFQVFADGEHRFLSRAWMISDVEIDEQKTRMRSETIGEWNGEYYASFGVGAGENRTWADAVKFGFISAGGARWYTNTLQLLPVGGRVWVNIPGRGYVGVGEAIGPVQRASEFMVNLPDGTTESILNVSQNKVALSQTSEDPDRSEYFVPIRWIKTVDANHAIKEVGLFGNQNSVCKPKTSKWTHTVERLTQLFEVS